MKNTVLTVIVALFLFGSCSSSDSKDNQTADTTQATDSTTTPDTTTDTSTPDDSTTLQDNIEDDFKLTSDLVIHTCCTLDDDCEQDMACVIRQGETEGVCYWPASGSSCYSSEDCNPYYVCIGAEFPLCDDGVVPTRGNCSPLDAGGCTTDGDCPTGTHCVGEATGMATCLPDLNNSYCWEDEECPEGQKCYGEHWCGADADCDLPNNKGACQDAAWGDCIEQYSGCGCEEGCMDGFGITIWYPATAGTFDEAIDPPQELLDVAVAKYLCAICTCEETWSFVQDGVLQPLEEGGAESFCTDLIKYQQECDDCLTTWFGGCC